MVFFNTHKSLAINLICTTQLIKMLNNKLLKNVISLEL